MKRVHYLSNVQTAIKFLISKKVGIWLAVTGRCIFCVLKCLIFYLLIFHYFHLFSNAFTIIA